MTLWRLTLMFDPTCSFLFNAHRCMRSKKSWWSQSDRRCKKINFSSIASGNRCEMTGSFVNQRCNPKSKCWHGHGTNRKCITAVSACKIGGMILLAVSDAVRVRAAYMIGNRYKACLCDHDHASASWRNSNSAVLWYELLTTQPPSTRPSCTAALI